MVKLCRGSGFRAQESKRRVYCAARAKEQARSDLNPHLQGLRLKVALSTFSML